MRAPHVVHMDSRLLRRGFTTDARTTTPVIVTSLSVRERQRGGILVHISSYIPMQQSASWRRLNVTALNEITIGDSVWHKHRTRIPLDLYGPLTEAAGFQVPKCDFGLGIVDDPDVHSACSSPMVPWKTYK